MEREMVSMISECEAFFPRPPQLQRQVSQEQCIVTKLVGRELPGVRISGTDVAQMRTFLSSWGLEEPEYALLMKHRALIKHQKEV